MLCRISQSWRTRIACSASASGLIHSASENSDLSVSVNFSRLDSLATLGPDSLKPTIANLTRLLTRQMWTVQTRHFWLKELLESFDAVTAVTFLGGQFVRKFSFCKKNQQPHVTLQHCSSIHPPGFFLRLILQGTSAPTPIWTI